MEQQGPPAAAPPTRPWYRRHPVRAGFAFAGALAALTLLSMLVWWDPDLLSRWLLLWGAGGLVGGVLLGWHWAWVYPLAFAVGAAAFWLTLAVVGVVSGAGGEEPGAAVAKVTAIATSFALIIGLPIIVPTALLGASIRWLVGRRR